MKELRAAPGNRKFHGAFNAADAEQVDSPNRKRIRSRVQWPLVCGGMEPDRNMAVYDHVEIVEVGRDRVESQLEHISGAALNPDLSLV
jgi:hypothetical protein